MLCTCVLTTLVVAAGSGSATPAWMSAVQRSMPTEKESRTPAQRKINSQLLYEIYRLRGEAARKQVPEGETGVRIDEKHRALVDVRVEVTPAMEKTLTALGATIVATSREHHSIVGWVPLLQLERIAKDPTVRAIEPAAESITSRPPKRRE